MSGLIDKWTDELAKQREKGEYSVFSNGASAASARQMISSFGSLGSIGKLKMPAAFTNYYCYSEASVSMLVDCFSP